MLQEAKPIKPVKTFLSYSHKDERYKNQFFDHLSALTRKGIIERWDGRQIEAGEVWEKELLEHFNEADLILCLISASFISSNYCYDVEMQGALKRQNAGQARVIPILLKECNWENTPFHELQIIPRDGQAILSYPSKRDRIFTKVVEEIEKVISTLRRGMA